ncbi:adenylate/guanylate cyclase catalytic domain protein [Ancylostoma caninum]|uniref:Guanylate cyclase n=1 Tax=Ancylostoma caninum TaxID=29170 RepID=A0A368GV69_ANCCA|nr:adenylate/guanylate cyclase catalytic domain protein [Ancylostoma caninum]
MSQVGELADAMLLYAVALNKSLASGIAKPRGTDLARFAQGTFEGFTGTVIINQNLSRDPVFYVWGLNSSDQDLLLMKITGSLSIEGVVINEVQPASVIWANHGGSPPLNRPPCGFDGKACPPSFVEQYLAVTLASVAVALVLMALVAAAIVYILRTKRKEEERLNLLWQIPFISLQRPNQKSGAISSRSLQSTMSTSTKLTIDSKRDTSSHSFFMMGNESIVARKHKVRTLMNKNDCAALRKMRSTDHDNLCRFIGLCMDAPELLSLWRYCVRGSLKDVIEKGSLQMDWFFKYSLIRDISEGIYFLHHTQFGAHGWISSSTCLVDERWQVKITYYGLNTIKALEVKEPKRLLWTAPEHIRDPLMPPTKEGDIYSFAIVCSEIVTKRSSWDLENQDYDLDEIIYKIKRGGRAPIRPSLDTDDEHNASLSLLIRDCWCEEPEQRPSCDQVRTLVKGFNHNKYDLSNIPSMGRDFRIFTSCYAQVRKFDGSRLQCPGTVCIKFGRRGPSEDEGVDRREEEKRHLAVQNATEVSYFSSFILIFFRQVAEKLKLGQCVEPETFDCVTLFFSDVVSFTTLASRCTPLQVVNLLNDLYTVFDAIIDEHDVYKVETIGDGYLCVSGLPHRNGNEHAKEIAEMSFSLLRAIRVFRIPHLPDEKINIRVGLHTGPVVTGVVGMTMPRYCLFGDTVNTASRMESNGKPGRVHISSDTQKFLTEKIGGYKTELRGEVIVKVIILHSHFDILKFNSSSYLPFLSKIIIPTRS